MERNSLFKQLNEKYINYQTEFKELKDGKEFKILGNKSDHDISLFADKNGLILYFMNHHTHFDSGLNDDFESICENIDEIIDERYIEYEVTYNDNWIASGGTSTEEFDFSSDIAFFNSFKRKGYLPIKSMKDNLNYILKVRSFKEKYDKDLIISISGLVYIER